MNIKLVIRFLLLLFVQVLVLNNFKIAAYVNPYIYVLFIILLPFSINRTFLLFSSFLLGLCIDMFSNTWGLHAIAATIMAFSRPFVIQLLSTGKRVEKDTEPNFFEMGLQWFFYYSLLLVFIHHFTLFLLESFRISEIGNILLRTFVSLLVTLLFVYVSIFLFSKRKKA